MDRAASAGIARCAQASWALLKRNLSPNGILAASRTEAAQARRYNRIFGRDGAICVLAMCGSGDAMLEQGALDTLDTLARAQADNGQIPKYVDMDGRSADFWYVGCIDATLWWLIAVDHVRRQRSAAADRWQAEVERALGWLRAQEHPHFALLQQNEASDWADIMPRSGYVLYTNALWIEVRRRFSLAAQENAGPPPSFPASPRGAWRSQGWGQATALHFQQLFDPFQNVRAGYHRTRLLQHHARRSRRDSGLYLSFVNLSFAGHEGDVFGNLLAIVCGAASESKGHAIVRTILQAGASDPYPIRVVLSPLTHGDALWRPYLQRHRQNLPHQYHNGGIWPFVGGFWVLALAQLGLRERAWEQLGALARANAQDGWRFTEWFHGHSLAPMGMTGQSWNAAMFLLAQRALQSGARPW